ncbi:MAG: hypothetical protein AAGA54_35830 [Myxococcota bacterium]
MLARAFALLVAGLLCGACNDDGGSAPADTDGSGCGLPGDDPGPCCCFPEPGENVCSTEALCPSISADCGTGMLGTGDCTLDPASDAAVMCALTALGAESAQGSVSWAISEAGGLIQSTGILHLGGDQTALEATIEDDSETQRLAVVGGLPDDFDAAGCATLETAGQRFECMLNVTALDQRSTCQDDTIASTAG